MCGVSHAVHGVNCCKPPHLVLFVGARGSASATCKNPVLLVAINASCSHLVLLEEPFLLSPGRTGSSKMYRIWTLGSPSR